jgi:hypothetical protein
MWSTKWPYHFWVSIDTSEPTPELIDSFISAKIPDPAVDPLGYALVAEHMFHGPCGIYNPNSLCMKDGRCLKNYPKEFHVVATTVDENSFAIYKRSVNQHFIIKGVLNWIIVG